MDMILVIALIVVASYLVLIAWVAYGAHERSRRAGNRAMSFLSPLAIVLMGIWIGMILVQTITDYLDRTLIHGK